MGGGAMRTAAKVAGIGVAKAGIRGGISSIPPPAEQSMRSSAMPVSAIISSSKVGSGDAAVAVQRPAWELDDWEFAGGVDEEEIVVKHGEPMPRLVFGSAPSLQEAKEATTDLKDALQKVYLSPPTHEGSGGSFGAGQSSGLPMLANSDHLETKSCITCDPKAASVPKYAIKAFELLNRSPAAQSVVASIASDPNVWDAVLKNESLQEFLEFQKTGKDESLQEFLKFQKTDVKVQEMGSPSKSKDLSDDESQDGTFTTETTVQSDYGSQFEKFKTETTDIFNNIKHTVVEMVSNVSAYIHNIFGFATPENNASAADGNVKTTFVDKTLGASFMALAVMVIMVVVVKRP